MPTALAPLIVAKSRRSWAGVTVASHLLAFWRRPSSLISANMSRVLFVVLPSVPMETLTPYCWNSGMGATPPVASFMLDAGQLETDMPASPISLTSLRVSHAEWAETPLGPRTPISESHSAGRMPVLRLWSLTSPLVSDRWKFIGASFSSERALAPTQVSSLHTYTPWRPTPGTILRASLCWSMNLLQLVRGLPFWVVLSSSRTHQHSTPRMPAAWVALAMTSSE